MSRNSARIEVLRPNATRAGLERLAIVQRPLRPPHLVKHRIHLGIPIGLGKAGIGALQVVAGLEDGDEVVVVDYAVVVPVALLEGRGPSW